MEFEQVDQFSDKSGEDSIGLREVLEKYLSNFKWFIICAVLFLGLSFSILQFSTPKFGISSTILIKDNEKGSSFANLTSFESFGLFGNGENSLENEIQILKSRKLITNVVKELHLNIRYFVDDSPINKEIFPNFPISVIFESEIEDVESLITEFTIEFNSDKSFNFIDIFDHKLTDLQTGHFFSADLGNNLLSNNQIISIILNEDYDQELTGQKIIVKINSVNNVADNLLQRIVIEPINTNLSKVIKVSLKESAEKKGIAIINNLIEQYNADGINDKNLLAQTTTDFLDLRIELISKELIAIEGTAEQFKTQNRMVDAKDGANYYLQSSSLNERELVEANTQLELISYMFEELNRTENSELLPGNIGLSDIGIINLIGEYNELVLQRNRVLKSSSIRNPIIVGIDSQLTVLKNNLINSLNSLKSSAEIKINSLATQSGKISSRIASVPKNERQYKDIIRGQETKNALYLFLLQKREESILSNAVNVDKAKIIDAAYSSGMPISPKKNLIYFASLLLGFLFPFLFIYIKDKLDTKIHSENDLKNLPIPYIGDIPFVHSKKHNFIDSVDNSSLAEAFRYIRTSISFMLDKEEKGKSIFVTSTLAGEGKSMTAINLAISLAISGKKTLLIGMDLRSPKLTKYLNVENHLGISNYIVSPSLNIDHLIERHEKFENLDYLLSGEIPPNPVELLMSKKVDEIFEYAKDNYEYIIVDTAPVGMVIDTIQINKFADLTIYVIKADFLDKRMLSIPKKIHYESKLINMCVLINGINLTKREYGYGYGYGKMKNKDAPWYKKLFKIITS